MTIDVIESLARLVLTENVFVYENNYYRQIKGDATAVVEFLPSII